MLHRDFREFLNALDANGAKYLLVSGYAAFVQDAVVGADP